MAENIVVRRGIKLYIDNVEIEANIKSIRAQMKTLTNEQSKMTLGSDEYVRHGQKIKELDAIYQQHRKSIKEVDDQLKDSGGSLSKWEAGIAGFFGGLATKAVDFVAGAFQNIGSFLTGSLEEWDKSAQAEKKLQNALKGRQDMLPGLIENSQKLQDAMNIPHEEIQAQEAFLIAQGRNEQQVKKTMMAAIQMAAVTGKDLPEAVKMLSGSWEGNVRGLNRLDAGIGNLTKQQLANGVAVDIINAKYKGFAETAANEGMGPIRQLGLIWGDIKEGIGGGIAGILLPLAASFKDIALGLRDMTEPAKTLNEQFHEQSKSFVELQDNTLPLLKRYDELKEKSNKLGGETHLSKDEHKELDEIIKKVTTDIPGAAAAFDKLGKAIAIDTGYSRDFIDAQKIIMTNLNKKTIDETTDSLKKVSFELKATKDNIDQIAKTHTFKIYTTRTDDGKTTVDSRDANAEEIKAEIEKNAQLLQKQKEFENAIKLLKGDPIENQKKTNAQIASEEKKAKDAELKYSKMSVKELEEIINNSDDDNEKRIASKALAVAKIREEAITKAQEKYKKYQEYLLKVQTLFEEASAQSIVASKDREIAIEQAAALKKLAEITGHTQLEEETRQKIKEASERKISDINQKYDQLETDHFLQVEKEKADRKLGIIADFQPQFLQLAIRYIEIERDIALNNDKLTTEERKNIYDKFLQQKLATEKAYGEARMNLVERDINNETSRYKAQTIMDDANQKFGYENRKKLMDIEYKHKLTTASNTNQSTLEIDAQYYADKEKLAEAYYNSIAEKIQFWADAAKSALSSIDQFQQNIEKRTIDAATYETDKKKALLKKQLDSKLITQADYDAKTAALDADLEKKKRKIEHDQAVRTKVMSTFEAGISIAVAITKALAPLTMWMIPIIASLGALQMAAIIASPIPAYVDGGFTNGNKVYRAGEKGVEYIAPNDQVDDPIMGPIIRMLNNQRIGKINKSAFLKPAMPAFNALQNVAGSASQSSATIIQQITSPAGDAEVKAQHETIKLLANDIKQLKIYMSDPNNRRTILSRDLMTRFDKEESDLRSLAQFKG